MLWIENMKNIATKGTPGKCPKCGSDNTDYSCKIVDKKNNNGCMDIWCNDCKSAYHVSRMEKIGTLKSDNEMPEGLRY